MAKCLYYNQDVKQEGVVSLEVRFNELATLTKN